MVKNEVKLWISTFLFLVAIATIIAIKPMPNKAEVVEQNIAGQATCMERDSGWICCYGHATDTAIKFDGNKAHIRHSPSKVQEVC